MSGYTMTQAETLFAGPEANYPAANAASASAQNLMTGASTDYQQPYIPAGFFQMGRRNQYLKGTLTGILTGQASATTAIITLQLATAPGTLSLGTGGGTLIATQAITVTSLSAVPWQLDFNILTRNVGYGTTPTSTSLYTSGLLVMNSATTGTGLVSVVPPTSLNTIDASLNWWLLATVTFSTSSATNSCTLEQVFLCGMN